MVSCVAFVASGLASAAFAGSFVAGAGSAWAAPAARGLDLPKVGDPAPAFEMRNEQGELVTLEELHGKKVVLAFYPKDFTPG